MISIREMDISDYDTVIELWHQSEGLLLREADSREHIARYLKRNPGLSFVALRQKQIVGAVLVGTDGRRGYLQHLAVSPDHRHQGIGSQLVSESIRALESIGILKTHLFVIHDNRGVQTFYEKLGWFPRDEVRMYSYNSSDERNA